MYAMAEGRTRMQARSSFGIIDAAFRSGLLIYHQQKEKYNKCPKENLSSYLEFTSTYSTDRQLAHIFHLRPVISSLIA